MSRVRTITLQPETKVTLVTDATSRGRYIPLEGSGPGTPIEIGPSSTVVLGPFNVTKKYRLVSDIGNIQYLFEFDGLEGVTEQQVIDILSSASFELITPQNNDQVLIKDSSDDGKLKAVTVQSIIDLASGGVSGSITETVAQANTFTTGDIIRLSGSLYIKSDASSESSAEVIGIVSSATPTEFTMVTTGKVQGLSGLVAGQVYFLSDTVQGGYTATPPYLEGTVIKPLFVADSTTSAHFKNYIGQNID